MLGHRALNRALNVKSVMQIDQFPMAVKYVLYAVSCCRLFTSNEIYSYYKSIEMHTMSNTF